MDPRRWWLLAGVAPALMACAVAASTSALRPLGDVAVVASGLIVAAVVWIVAGRKGCSRGSWRLLALAPLFPVLGALLAAAIAPEDPVDAIVVRWVPMMPGYLLAIIAILSLVERRRLLAAGARLAVEATLFTSACLVVVQTLTIGSADRWASLGVDEQAILTAAVLVTSATMAAALTLLGAIEPQRQPMALVLLCGAVLLTVGRGLGTSAHLWGATSVEDISRFLVCSGLWLLAVAVVVDPGPNASASGTPAGGRSTELGQTLPHLAMLVATGVLGAVLITGGRIMPTAVAGMVLCAVLATVHRWVTAGEARRMAARLGRREAYFRSLVRSSSDAVVILDGELRVTAATAALERVLGSAADQLIGRPVLDVVHPEDRASLAAALPDSGAAEAETGGLLLLRLLDAEGGWRAFEAGTNDLRSDPDVGAVVLHCRDMTERLTREQALLSVAYTDPMTGLPNRAGFIRALEQQLDRGDPVDEESVLMTIELDGVAAARQRVGREVVTAVMGEVASRLRATVRGDDVLARLGGGAFAVLSHGGPGEAERLASRLLSVVEQPLVTAEGVVELAAGIGLATVEGDSVDELFHRADLAVRAAREGGLGWARRYDASLGEAADRRDRLRTALQGARSGEQLFLMYQPIKSLTEDRITGLEAQLRWRHPELGEVPPAEFLPVAERAGLVTDLMRWALGEATRMAVSLPTALPGSDEPLRIGLKIPTGYAATGTLVPDVEQALRHSGLSPERLVLQISSPTVGADDERTGLDVTSLRLMGVHVALEGFGSADSALSHLTRWPIDIVKIDRSLITRIDRDPQSRALCESVIGIGRGLGLDIVAEGVETPAQLAALAGFGCSFAQGFHIARPVAGTGVPALLAGSAQSAETGPGLVGSR